MQGNDEHCQLNTFIIIIIFITKTAVTDLFENSNKSLETRNSIEFLHTIIELSRHLKYNDTSPILLHNKDSNDIYMYT